MDSKQLDYETKSRMFSALADPTRLEILNLLINTPNTCVSALADILNLTVSAVSQQCKLLELSGFLRRTRQGQRICYQVRTDNRDVQRALKLIK